jgi:hypothetical protein
LEGLRYTALLTVLTIFAGGTAYATLEDQPTAWDGEGERQPRFPHVDAADYGR